MKDGFVKLNIINMLLSGVAGSGKTSLKLLLTDQPPPTVRNSTPCLVKPVRVDLPPMSSSKIRTTGRGWEEISQKKMLNILAQIIAKRPKKSGDPKKSNLVKPQSFWMRFTEALRNITVLKSRRSNPHPPTSDESSLGSAESTNTIIDDVISKAVESVVSEVAQELTDIEREHDPTKATQNQEGELFDSTWVYISDSGGQPQFHDISPLFIRHISVAAIVVRLIDDFSRYPLDEYYKDGQLVGTPCESHMTLGETLKSLIRCIQSHCSQEKMPKLMFVGTFLDQLASFASIEEKCKAILDMLPASMKKQVVYNESLKHPIFAINTLSREGDAMTIAESIRKAIEACHPLEIKVPIWWFFLDFNLQKLSLQLSRGVLRKRECFMLAIRFGFENEDLEAALDFFNEVCIAHYYRSILPDTVFVNAQIPLDKISELTEYAILLRNADTKGAIDGEWKRMADEGVIKLEFLKLDHFKKHYVEGIFSPEDMLLIMKELLVIAPIPLVGEPDCPLLKAEFFMPSLLKSIPPTELVKHRKSSDAISPIAISFPSGCIRSGVFCCLVVYLMNEPKWEVLLPSGDPVLLAKNCVKFRFPSHPCTVTLIDSFSYIEVHVDSPPAVSKKLCPTIRDQLLEGIRAACEILHYNNDSPIVSIFCPCTKSTEQTHLAEINNGYWTCFLQAGVWGDLSPQSTVWLGKSSNNQGNYSVLANTCIVNFHCKTSQSLNSGFFLIVSRYNIMFH